jgi:hypothetical protein
MPELLEQSPPADAADQYRVYPLEAPGRVREDQERLVRGDLRRQIAALERELAELFATAFPRTGIEFTVPAAGGPRVLPVAELERVRDALAGRVQDVRGWLSDRAYVEERKRELLELMIAEPESYPWIRVSNEDIGEPGCRHWHSRPRWGPLGMLFGWWRVKLSSGCPLARGRGPAASRTKIEWRRAEGRRPDCEATGWSGVIRWLRSGSVAGAAQRPRDRLRPPRARPRSPAPPPARRARAGDGRTTPLRRRGGRSR